MPQRIFCRKIECFQCGALCADDQPLCPSCGFDVGSEVSERRTSCLYLRLAAVAFIVGSLAPVLTLLMIGEFSARLMPAVGVAVVIAALGGCAWIWAETIKPVFVLEPASEDLRSLDAEARSDSDLGESPFRRD